MQAGFQDLAELALHLGDVRAGSGRAARVVSRAALMPLQGLRDVLHRVPADRRIGHQPGEVSDLRGTGRRPQDRVSGDCRPGPADERPDLSRADLRPVEGSTDRLMSLIFWW